MKNDGPDWEMTSNSHCHLLNIIKSPLELIDEWTTVTHASDAPCLFKASLTRWLRARAEGRERDGKISSMIRFDFCDSSNSFDFSKEEKNKVFALRSTFMHHSSRWLIGWSNHELEKLIAVHRCIGDNYALSICSTRNDYHREWRVRTTRNERNVFRIFDS